MDSKSICILFGSPRKNGNTKSLVMPFVKEMEAQGHPCKLLGLYEKTLLPCCACRICQRDWTIFGCPQQDDM